MANPPVDLSAAEPMNADELVRSLKGSETAAIMNAVVRELPALQSCTAYQTVAAVLAAHQAVPSLAARLASGGSAEPKRFVSGAQVMEHYVAGYQRPAPESPYPAPVPSAGEPEPTTCATHTFVRLVDGVCEMCHRPAPSEGRGPTTNSEKVDMTLVVGSEGRGAETGWMTKAGSWAVAEDVARNPRGEDAESLMTALCLFYAEAKAQRSRADAAERELRRRIEQGDRFTQVIEQQRAALTAAEAQRDQAVTLAGEAITERENECASCAEKEARGELWDNCRHGRHLRARLAKLTKEGT